MNLWPLTPTALVIGLLLVVLALASFLFFLWYTLPNRIKRTVDERFEIAEAKIKGLERKIRSWHDLGLDELEDEMNHQRRRNKKQPKR